MTASNTLKPPDMKKLCTSEGCYELEGQCTYCLTNEEKSVILERIKHLDFQMTQTDSDMFEYFACLEIDELNKKLEENKKSVREKNTNKSEES